MEPLEPAAIVLVLLPQLPGNGIDADFGGSYVPPDAAAGQEAG